MAAEPGELAHGPCNLDEGFIPEILDEAGCATAGRAPLPPSTPFGGAATSRRTSSGKITDPRDLEDLYAMPYPDLENRLFG